MSVSRASASDEPAAPSEVSGQTLICGVNWLGDSVMCMPAVQTLKRRHPTSRLVMLVKSGMEPLWRMHCAVDDVIASDMRLGAFLDPVREVRAGRYGQCLVFPNSLRSAIVPYLAGIPIRVGMPGHSRAWMLTRVVRAPTEPGRYHQAWEYMAIGDVADETSELEAPRVSIPAASRAQAGDRLAASAGNSIWIGLIPGAARGPSKQWPPEHFIETGRQLTAAADCRMLIMGTGDEIALCRRVASGIGGKALCLAGETAFVEFAALLSQCRVVVANDSGGMHLATAVGVPVVAVYGLTDPGKTGPIGPGHCVIQPEIPVAPSRRIARDSIEARDALRSIVPARVSKAVMQVLAGRERR